MKKQIVTLKVKSNNRVTADCVCLILESSEGQRLPESRPGQFVNVAVNDSGVLLRRPISIHYVSDDCTELHLLVKKVGHGTNVLADTAVGDTLSVVMPLGNGFPIDEVAGKRVLLIGGGIGVAPLLYYGHRLKSLGAVPTFLLGARSADDMACIESFEACADVEAFTDDGSAYNRGFVTLSPLLKDESFDFWAVCGPTPMMKAIARIAHQNQRPCYVSLENTMACGVGGCLCCVEKTTRGNVCTCTEGPVFNINELIW